MNDNNSKQSESCPKCGSDLGEVIETSTGRKLQRCSTGGWDKETKTNIGCPYVKWLAIEPITLDEQCPKCNAPLVLNTTRFGKKMKKCSTGGWDKETKKTTGCDYIEWINGTSEPLDEKCPECNANLILFTTNKGKKMKKCSTGGWDKTNKVATGCTYVKWLKPGEYPNENNNNEGEENLPPPPPKK